VVMVHALTASPYGGTPHARIIMVVVVMVRALIASPFGGPPHACIIMVVVVMAHALTASPYGGHGACPNSITIWWSPHARIIMVSAMMTGIYSA